MARLTHNGKFGPNPRMGVSSAAQDTSSRGSITEALEENAIKKNITVSTIAPTVLETAGGIHHL